MAELGAKTNSITKATTKRLGRKYAPKNTCLKTFNYPIDSLKGCRPLGVSITLGKWKGRTNFTVAPLDIFDIIVRQFF